MAEENSIIFSTEEAEQGMRRKIMDKLLQWKSRKNRKPLILWGARQTGKTWILKEFGRTAFADTVYISFYNNSRIASIFDQDYDVHRILNAIEIELHVKIQPQKTLLIFDEVQGAAKVVEALKYFCEDAPEYAVAAAGSLLGVALHEGISFPVGKVDELKLFPMSFEEFLWAMNEDKLADYLHQNNIEEINAFRDRYLDYLRSYFVIGGMPAVVLEFSQSGDYPSAREMQNAILHQYEGDFGKHIPPQEIARVRMVWNSIPVQLAKENKKFFFGQIKRGARSKEYETALQWLEDAGLIYRVQKVTKPALPLKSYAELTAFKVYMLDIGLLGALSELDPYVILHGNNAFVEFKGALTEQYVYQQLTCETSYPLYYFATEKSTYEVDFLLQKNASFAPLEVKAAENLKSHSLQMFHEKYQPLHSYRTSMSNYRKQDWLTNIPLWAIQNL